MVWPNCLRVAAHWVALSSARCARPTHCAATVRRVAPSQVLATSNPRCSSPRIWLDRHPAIREHQLAMMEAAVGHRARPEPHVEARRALVHQERGDALLVALRRLLDAAGGEQHDEIGDIGIGDEMLGAVDDIDVALALGPRLHGAQVGAGVGLRQRQAFHPLAADRRLEIALDLLALAGAQDVRRPRDGILQGKAGAAELALHQRQRHMIQPAAAQILRHVRGIESGLQRLVLDLLDQLRPHLVRALDFVLMGRQFRLDKRAHAVDEHLLFRGQAELHGRTPRAAAGPGNLEICAI